MNDEVSAPRRLNYLFICGAPRSGTTAIAQLLNHHPKISVGIERYKNVKPADLGEHLFVRERFFDFRPTDTNIRARKTYVQLETKYQNARWLGDKVPRYYTRYDALFEHFRKSVVIFMLRDIHAVASSWNKRAQDPEDKWPENNNYIEAVREWNEALALTLKIGEKYRNRLLVVEYEQLFCGNVAVLTNILARLNLVAPNNVLRLFQNMTRDWEKRYQKSLIECEWQAYFINANADIESYAKLRDAAVQNVAQEGDRRAAKMKSSKRNAETDFIGI